MTLHKLTLSISILAASLMLTVPAHAEAWVCSFLSGNKPYTQMFIRRGETFYEESTGFNYNIVGENDYGIHLTRKQKKFAA